MIHLGRPYRHYRNGKTYLAVLMARDHSSEEEVIVYHAGDDQFWVRPRKEFEEKFSAVERSDGDIPGFPPD